MGDPHRRRVDSTRALPRIPCERSSDRGRSRRGCGIRPAEYPWPYSVCLGPPERPDPQQYRLRRRQHRVRELKSSRRPAIAWRTTGSLTRAPAATRRWWCCARPATTPSSTIPLLRRRTPLRESWSKAHVSPARCSPLRSGTAETGRLTGTSAGGRQDPRGPRPPPFTVQATVMAFALSSSRPDCRLQTVYGE